MDGSWWESAQRRVHGAWVAVGRWLKRLGRDLEDLGEKFPGPH